MGTVSPRVSIGLPVYNGQRYLEEALDALLAQTYNDFELIIGDNGSSDDTEAICKSYAARDPRIQYLRSPRNRGISWNFNRLVHHARGEYFRWQSYDDLCAPTLLAQCVEVLDRAPDVVLCYGRTAIIDADGAVMGDYDEGLDLRSTEPYRRYKQYHLHYRHGAFCNVHYGLMRRAVLTRTRLIAPYVDSDVVLIGELALRGPFYEIPETLFFRRDHPQISVRATPTSSARLALLAPHRTGQGKHPYARLLAQHLDAVARVPLRGRDRMSCLALLGCYVSWKTYDYLEARLHLPWAAAEAPPAEWMESRLPQAEEAQPLHMPA